jgi:predicted lipoprotein with Yx(FWY)xxD motif
MRPRFPARVSRHASRVAALALTMLAVAAIAGCGGSGGGGGGGGDGDSGGGPATIKAATISGFGTGVVTNGGKSVYMLSSDPSGSSKCSGSCLKLWVPLTVSGSPSAGNGVDSSKLSSFKRADGGTQVLYDHHALYTYAGQGSSSGQGIKSEGGTWYLMGPSGKPITKTAGGHY